MRRNPLVQPSAFRDAFPDRRVAWLISAVTATAATMGLVMFNFERPPGVWWKVALFVIASAGLWFLIHVARAIGWRHAVRSALTNDVRWWRVIYAPTQTARERSVSGWFAWTACCLTGVTSVVIFIIFTARNWL